MRILVTGGRGLLGTATARAAEAAGHEIAAPGREELDVTDRRAVERSFAPDRGPDAVIQCAAYADVDGAEDDPQAAMAVNAEGARTVAEAAAAAGVLHLYPSTDYVFDGEGERPYLPHDAPCPVNAYGRSKAAGEEAVREAGGRWLVVRTSWLYGAGGGNFVEAIRARARGGEELRVVDDQEGRPTWTGSFAPALIDLIEGGVHGRVLHLADRGTATWFALAREVVERDGAAARIVPVSTEEWGAPARRPLNSVLDISSGEDVLGRTMSHWKDSLARYLAEEDR